MANNTARAYSEVYSILKFVDEYYINKVSSKFIDYICNQKDNSYNPNIDLNIPLENQELLEETINILALMKFNYWCEDDDEKKELLNLLNKNEDIFQQNIREKYNPNDIFKHVESKTTAMVKYKEPIFKRILKKIMNIFKKY